MRLELNQREKVCSSWATHMIRTKFSQEIRAHGRKVQLEQLTQESSSSWATHAITAKTQKIKAHGRESAQVIIQQILEL